MRDIFEEIWASVRRNKLRTCLTGFAVAWGIFMLIVLLGAGNGLLNAFTMGSVDILSNTMQVGGGYTSKPYDGLKEGRRIRLEDKDAALTAGPAFTDHVDEVSASCSKDGQTISYGKKSTSESLMGVHPDYARMNKVTMVAGRFINPYDIRDKRKVMVLSSQHVEYLLDGRKDWDALVGKTLRVGSLAFQVVGVYKSDRSMMNSEVYVPYSTLKSAFTMDKYVDDITFTFHGLATEPENEAFENDYRSVINTAHRAAPDDRGAIWIWNRFTQNMQMDKGKNILTIALWIIGLFTLLSGIVGVSNIMLITVKERTHEFGIRKAIGASPWDVTKLILAESVTITAFFGYVGMILGMLACEILDLRLGQSSVELMGQQMRIFANPTVGVDVAVQATLLLIVAGTVAGLFPARKAAKVRPIEALRAD